MFKIKTNTREFIIRDGDEEKLFDQCIKTLFQLEGCVLNNSKPVLNKTTRKPEPIVENRDVLEAEEAPAAEEQVEEPVEHYDSGADVEYDEKPVREKRFKGFVHMECEHCGEIVSTCLKGYFLHYICNHCGQKTKMTDDNMRKVNMKCQCGKEFYYHTNRTDGMFDIECVNCGNPVTVEWNKKEKAYATIGGAY
ncbi:MAG: hypothetical protein IKZ01_01190 [Anaerotignum sp.]|nr:hypothetical protein [Anaerotignum sp.]